MDDIYFDSNATTSLDPRVKKVFLSALDDFGNPSSIYARGRRAKARILEARAKIAAAIGVKEEEIVFTSGGTESMQLLLRGILEKKKPGRIVSSASEHACVVKILESYAREKQIEWMSPGLFGAVTLEELTTNWQKGTSLVTLMAVNNETGVKTDIASIAAYLEKEKVPFIVDGVALLGKGKLEMPRGVWGIGFSGHKIHAPQGTGFVVIRNKKAFAPFLAGGGQEFGLRGGTENVAGIAALGEAVTIAAGSLEVSEKEMKRLMKLFWQLLTASLEGVSINGEGPKISNTLNVYFEDVEGEELLMALDLQGVSASHGSACSTGALEPSRVLLAMGLPRERVRSSLRFSISRMTTEREIRKGAEIIVSEVKRLRNFFGLQ